MTLFKRFVLIGALVTLLSILHIFVFGVWARVYGFLDSSLIGFSIGAGVVLVLLNMLPRIKDNQVTSLLYVFGSTWLGAIFLVFSATVVYQTLYYMIGGDNLLLYLGLQSCAVFAAFYAIFNADRIETKSISIPFTGIVAPVRIVHLSDIHIGTVHRKSFLQQVVEITNEQKPDLVLITGDLFDGSAPVYPDMLTPLDDVEAPSYFSYGNHEEYEGLPLVKNTIQNLRLKLLDNKKVDWNGIEIIGVNDAKSLRDGESLDSVLSALSLEAGKPKILMYHTPIDWEVARKHDIALMLSGHTHNGQVFPFTLLVRVVFKYIKGLYEEGGKFLHVTPGTGTWGPPMRLGSRNQITVIKLLPDEK